MNNIIDILTTKLKNYNQEINNWLLSKIKGNIPYSSFDLRCSGIKISPVDSNLFPSGFNNLSENDSKKASLSFAKLFNKKNILLIIEEYTRNTNYLKNVVSIKKIIEDADNYVVCGTLNNIEINNDQLKLENIKKINNQIITESGFIPEIIFLNNDMTIGPPEILLNLQQHVIPNINAGWFNRKKSNYFNIYNSIAKEFATSFDFDPWLISTMFECAFNVDFKNTIGMDDIAYKAEILLNNLKMKYKEYDIDDEPYLFLKPNNGTHGMGIGLIHNAEEIYKINKNFRKKMHTIKNNVVVTDIIMQEGIKTVDFYENQPAEPMVYVISNTPIAYFYRYNSNRNEYSSLNSTGVNFISMINNANKNYINIIDIIAKLSLIATEIEYDSL